MLMYHGTVRWTQASRTKSVSYKTVTNAAYLTDGQDKEK